MHSFSASSGLARREYERQHMDGWSHSVWEEQTHHSFQNCTREINDRCASSSTVFLSAYITASSSVAADFFLSSMYTCAICERCETPYPRTSENSRLRRCSSAFAVARTTNLPSGSTSAAPLRPSTSTGSLVPRVKNVSTSANFSPYLAPAKRVARGT